MASACCGARARRSSPTTRHTRTSASANGSCCTRVYALVEERGTGQGGRLPPRSTRGARRTAWRPTRRCCCSISPIRASSRRARSSSSRSGSSAGPRKVSIGRELRRRGATPRPWWWTSRARAAPRTVRSRASRRACSTSASCAATCASASPCCARARLPASSAWARTSPRRSPTACWCCSTGAGARTSSRARIRATARAAPRRSACGLPAIHYFVSGRAFTVARERAADLDQGAHGDRDLGAPRDAPRGRARPRRPNCHARDLADQGRERLRPPAGARRSERQRALLLGQLLGIQLADAKAFLLCTIKWLSVSDRLRAAHRGADPSRRSAGDRDQARGRECVRRIRSLRASSCRRSLRSRLLRPWSCPPAGSSPSARWRSPTARAGCRLVELVDRGADFERVSFESA